MTVPTLRTERLILRAPEMRDSRVVAKALNNFAISRWLTAVPFPYGITDAQWFINECIKGRTVSWFIWANDRYVGTIGLGDGLGYWLAQDAWGQGYATEAAGVVVDFHFETTTQNSLKSGYFVENDASLHVLKKLGFEDVGQTVQFSKARQADVTGRTMRLPRAAWDRLRTNAQ